MINLALHLISNSGQVVNHSLHIEVQILCISEGLTECGWKLQIQELERLHLSVIVSLKSIHEISTHLSLDSSSVIEDVKGCEVSHHISKYISGGRYESLLIVTAPVIEKLQQVSLISR